MNTTYLTPADWATLRQRHPAAASFLDEAGLVSELKYLRTVALPNRWQRERVAELEAWAGSTNPFPRHAAK